MKYSVLMTVYKNDNADYFYIALNSMVQQTIKPDEIVIVKDGPIPNLLEQVIVNVQNSCDIYFNEIQLPNNVGLGEALNAGLKECRNDLIARMDADDYSLPQRCELQLREFEKDSTLDIIGSSVEEFISELDNIVGRRIVPTTHDEIYKFAKKRDPFNHPTVMYRKSFLDKIGGYSDYRKNQDTDLWIRMLESGAKTKNLDEIVFKFRFEQNTFEKRKNWFNTKTLIHIRYNAWKRGFNSLGEFLEITAVQIAVYILPQSFQRFLYKHFLRG
ncbi:glycosyltransferase [Streptococcus suis]|uniref:glycosyltransferase n=1 Tax=Streptococcus suis TaxID=1307 RepID=UPI001C9819EA|nr:glycosyltransferase [Streptococcus suis]MBY4954710.1 glycosyltransferase [Streptococcus suis]